MLPTRKCNKISHMASETALHPNAAPSSRTQAGQLVSLQAQRALAAPLCACAAPTGKEDFLWVCGRRVTEPALLSDDQLSACSLSLSLLSDPLSLFLSSVALISSLLHLCLRLCTEQYPPHHPLPLSTAEEAKQCRPTHPPSCVSLSFNATHPSSLLFHPKPIH